MCYEGKSVDVPKAIRHDLPALISLMHDTVKITRNTQHTDPQAIDTQLLYVLIRSLVSC